MTRHCHTLIALAAALVGLAASAAGLAARPQDDALRQEVLKLNDLVGDDVIMERLEALKKDLAKAKQLVAAGVPLAQEKESPLNYTAASILGQLAREVRDLESGKVYFRLCIDLAQKLKSERKLALAYLDLIDLFFAQRKYDEAEKLCKEFLETDSGNRELDGGKFLAIRRMVQVTAMQGKLDEANKILQPFAKVAPDNPSVLEMQAWLLRFAGKYDESAKVYEQLIEKVDTDELKDTIRYYLSGLYADARDVDKATGELQALLKKKPDSPTYNNDLGYIWADADRNLDEAEKMIKKALDAEPNNPSYLDSMAWVLFRQKKHKEAKEYILKAVADEDGQSMELFEHLGDIHAALGEKEQATAAYKKALELAGFSKRDQERKADVEKKLKGEGSGP